MASPTNTRIESIDLLKGLVMVIMALDHTRDYFHYANFIFSPTDPTHTTLPIFFTRWITHFCAPAFSFLAGVSAFMVGQRKSTNQLAGFLIKRGIWLVFVELVIVNFAWYFDVQFRTIGLQVIWSLGVSMIVLAALVYLPRNLILAFSCILIFGHDVLDNIHFKDSVPWALFHERGIFPLSENMRFMVVYPIVPWIAVMSLGYYFGAFYTSSFDPAKRKKIFNVLGFTAIIIFVLLRWSNLYGNPTAWQHYDTLLKEFFSFMNPNKYPPSLLYLLMTLGPALIFLANSEKLKGRIVNFFSTFGRVPFFYYILHLYLIHIIAMVFAQLSGFGWQKMILSNWISLLPGMKGYGFPLWVVYAVWVGIIAAVYPLCKKFDAYKQSHKEKWWLSYL